MKKIFVERHASAQQSLPSGALHMDLDACEDLARLLGGVGTPTESHSLSARLAAAIEDLGAGRGL